ncbi:WxL protein peptidoglycan domain-containing protein [Micromonospora sp. NPDC003197]
MSRLPHPRRALLAMLAVAAMISVPMPAAATLPITPTPPASPTVPPVGGDGGLAWSVQPSGAGRPAGRDHFVYQLAPGGQTTDHVTVGNRSDRPQTFTVYGTDGFTTTDGAFALLPASQPPVDVGAWIHFDQRTYTVPAGKQLDIPFRLTVPTNVTPGDHAGGVIGSLAQVQVDADGQRVNVDRRIAARVYLRVSGPVQPGVTVETIQTSYANPVNPLGGGDLVVTYRIRNTGNVRVTGTGALTVHGPLGWRLAQTDQLDLPELLPGSTFTVTERIAGVPPVLRLTTTVDLAASTVDTALPPVVRTSSIWAPPWLLLAGLAAGGLAFAVRRWRRRRRRAQISAQAVGPAHQAGQ